MQSQLNESLSTQDPDTTQPLLASEDEILFNSNGILTLGVEIELQLIDAETYNLCSRAEDVLNAVSHLEKIKQEFYLSTIEVNTSKCSLVQEVEEDLYATLVALQHVTKKMDILLATTGSHPFSKYSDWEVSPTTRYQELIDRN
ncbi:glutamate-cysteine ligase, partial [Legionella parisiensis]